MLGAAIPACKLVLIQHRTACRCASADSASLLPEFIRERHGITTSLCFLSFCSYPLRFESTHLLDQLNMSTMRSAHYCDHCDKSFARAYILRDHMNSIRGIKAYNCTTCSIRFSRNHDLKVHQKEQHSLEQPSITCRIITSSGSLGCHRDFKRQSDLLRHLRAPAGQFCRLSSVKPATPAPEGSREIVKAARRDYMEPSLTSWVITNDAQSGNLLDQNRQVNWYQCYLTIRANAWVAMLGNAARPLHDAPLSLQLMTDLIHITQYFAKQGCGEVVTRCAQTLFWATNEFEPEAAQAHLNLLCTTSMLLDDQSLSMLTHQDNMEHALAMIIFFMKHLEEQLRSLWTDGPSENEVVCFLTRALLCLIYMRGDYWLQALVDVFEPEYGNRIHSLRPGVKKQVLSLTDRFSTLVDRISAVFDSIPDDWLEEGEFVNAEASTILVTIDKIHDVRSLFEEIQVLVTDLRWFGHPLASYVDHGRLLVVESDENDGATRQMAFIK